MDTDGTTKSSKPEWQRHTITIRDALNGAINTSLALRNGNRLPFALFKAA
jgi:hypothetical protein